MAIKYDPIARRTDDERIVKQETRPQGSLYGYQRRQVADATMWLKDNARHALIFCLTSPGYTSVANTTNVLSKFLTNCRNRYGLGHYVWVREMTTAGYPHFHFIADWHSVKYWFKRENSNGKTQIEKLSEYWAKLCRENDDSGNITATGSNSIRLGSYDPRTKKRSFYVRSERQCWYLAKYIGKTIGEESTDYLAEAGFPQVRYKKTVRTFGISKELAKLSQPTTFESSYEYKYERRRILCADGYRDVDCPVRIDRVWTCDSDGVLIDENLREYRWKNVGHGDTWIGFKQNNNRKSL